MKTQSKEEPLVIATGGLANLIAGETQAIDVVDPFLTLKGYISYINAITKK